MPVPLSCFATVPQNVRRRALFAWFVLASIALLAPMPEAWHSLESKSVLPLDKLAHLVGTLIGALLAHWIGWTRTRNLAIGVLYAGGMEFVQLSTGYRAAEWLDFGFALAGLALGILTAPHLLRAGTCAVARGA
jgi:VanZ family protein